MKVLLKTSVFLTVFLCSISIFAQSSEWIAADKIDDIEAFYRFEKSGSNSYEVEVKVINHRAKSVDVIVKFEQKEAAKKRPADLIRSDNSKYIKLTIKAKETSVSEKVEVDGSELVGVKIVCWSNTDSKKKCDLDSFGIKPRVPAP